MNSIHEERIVMCKECQAEFEVARLGQSFCSRRCRNRFNNRKNKVLKKDTATIDKILHRNRELLSKRVGMELSIAEMEKAGFNFNYFTSIVRKDGKAYHFCYEYIYLFTKDEFVKIFLSNQSN